MCVLAGCDYLKNIPLLGINLAYVFIKQVDNVTKLYDLIENKLTSKGCQKFPISKDRIDEHRKAVITFKHQLIFDPQKLAQLRFIQYDGQRSLTFAGM